MRRHVNRTGRWLGAAWVAATGLLASNARADEPHVACVATVSGRRVLVKSQAFAFMSSELERLVKLGLAGKLEVELTLLRKRALWFDTRVEGAVLTQVLAFTRGGYVLDGRPLASGTEPLELERVAWSLETAPATDERWVVRINVRLHVVTAASLGRVAEWLTQDPDEGEARSPMSKTLLRSLAEDLARDASGRCDVTRVP
ncbi:hypothetical protein KRR26_25815 [Corallococcus sp. M34]|uniref:hypothetical protein n=1 Tax=Citreicoccus inhibens TaxID=2849499 RepID=UPI001C248FE8|nr:hypothetical protein [Citreicoccus inhibens]MBU8899035.1 hypothetical protein [Citreicoccus inhibens]